MLGTTIDGRYQVLRLLGEGGMGSVYEVRHVGTSRRLALKIITGEFARSPALIQRFQIEAKAAGVIESQHVANVLDVGVDPKTGTPYLVMEYLEGQTLEQHLAARRAFPVELALRVAGQALLGLSKAHGAGIIHRDVKPGNVFLAERDAGEIVVKLLDFGIAKVRLDEAAGGATPSVTRTGHLVGTPLYMSPEQAGGDRPLTFSTDIWSLGVVMYEMISGRTPHHDVQAAGRLIIEICSTPTPPLRKYATFVDPQVEAIVMRALELDAALRFRDAKEMIDALRALVPSFSIDESMLAPARKLVISASSDDISPESFARQPTAPAVPSTPPDSLATAVSGEAPTVQVRASTTGASALARQRDAAKPRGNALPWILLALGAVASIAFFWQRSSNPNPNPSASATTVALPAPSAPPPATSVAALPTAPPSVELDAGARSVKRTVRVEKAPEKKTAPSSTPAKKPYDPLSEM